MFSVKRESLIVVQLLTIIFFFAGCTQKASFVINGTITSKYEGYIYLKYKDNLDSTLIVDQNFTFAGSVDHPIFARLFTKGGHFSGLFFLENSNMNIEISIKDNVTSIDSISGNNTIKIWNEFSDYYMENHSNPDFSMNLYHKLDSVLSENPRNELSGKILSDVASEAIFSSEEVSKLFSKIDTTTQNKHILKSIRESIVKLETYKVGANFGNFGFSNQDGKLLYVEKHIGAVLLIEFWASWCAPCRENNQELLEVYDKYKNRGFEIFAVSLDAKKENWLNAAKEDGFPWINTRAENHWKNKNIKKLAIQAIPSNFLINKDGTILAINIHLKQLEDELSKLLGD